MRRGYGPPKQARAVRLNHGASSSLPKPSRSSSFDDYGNSKRKPEPAYGPEWKATTEFVRKRDNYTCTNNNCRKVLRPPYHGGLDAHHIIRREAGGSDRPDNLRTLCKSCHALEHPHLLKMGYGKKKGR